MSWAEVKKINSDMSKPLDDLLNEKLDYNYEVGANAITGALNNLKKVISNKFGFATNTFSSYNIIKAASQGEEISISGKGEAEIRVFIPENKGSQFSNGTKITIVIDGVSTSIPLIGYIGAVDVGLVLDVFFTKSLVCSTAPNGGVGIQLECVYRFVNWEKVYIFVVWGKKNK